MAGKVQGQKLGVRCVHSIQCKRLTARLSRWFYEGTSNVILFTDSLGIDSRLQYLWFRQLEALIFLEVSLYMQWYMILDTVPCETQVIKYDIIHIPDCIDITFFPHQPDVQSTRNKMV